MDDIFWNARLQRIHLCYYLRMATTSTENPAVERAVNERSTPERKEPTYLFTEKYVSEKSETARKFLDTRERLNANVDKANNFLVKRFYNLDHNTYLEGALSAKTKELMGLVASACLRCDDCIFYHAIQAYRLGVTRAEQEARAKFRAVTALVARRFADPRFRDRRRQLAFHHRVLARQHDHAGPRRDIRVHLDCV